MHVYMGSGFIPLHCRNNHVCGDMGSEKLFRQGCTRAQYPIWLSGRVHISINVLRRVAAKLTVHSAINIGHFQFYQLYQSLFFVLVIA